MLGWCFYGECALRYLSGGRNGAVLCYRAVFIACTVWGSVAKLGVVWAVSDMLNALMAIPNCAALILLRREVVWGDKAVKNSAAIRR
jgi:AGCS family alanine or glycine:cation symporter